MRLRADIWVKGYVRRCSVAGAFAAVVRHGDDDAGAIFIRVNRLDGTSLLFGPAPAGLDHAAHDRLWTVVGLATGIGDEEVEARLRREIGIDSDCWIIEVEDRQGRHFLGEELLSEGR